MSGGRLLATAGILLALAIQAPGATSPDEDETHLYPFPPGENAAVTRQTCSECHDGTIVTARRYDEESARRYFRLMVGNPETELGRKVIAYLTDTLGEEK
jgi:hypothetical protein